MSEKEVLDRTRVAMGRDATASIVPSKSRVLVVGEVVARCREHMAHFKTPRRIEFVEGLSRTAVGKPKKFDLRSSRASRPKARARSRPGR